MQIIARLLQWVGLGVPLASILLELNHLITLGQMLVALVMSLCAFWLGRMVEGYLPRP